MEEPGQPHINQKDFPNLLKSILERITDAFVALDKNWCYTYMNKKAGEIFNRQPEQMIGKHIWTEFPEGIGQPFYKAYHKAMAEQQYIYLEEYYTPYDKWFENHIYPSPEGLSIYFRDITHTKKQFLNIQESEERFRQLFENSMDAILLTAPDGSIYSANPAATRMFGRPEEEIKQIGRNGLVDVSDPRLKPALEERAKKGSFLGELNFFRKNGTKFTAEVSTSLFLDNEQRQRTTMIIRDITERKRIEQLLDTEKIVLEMISSGASLDLILEKIVLNIEVLTPGTIASILLLDIDGLHIHYGVSPHLPVDYNKALEGVEIGPQAGSCGTAAYRRELVIVTDIESDPLWINYRELARTYGLRACWSLPILNSEGKVLGTFAMYFMKPQSPKEEDIKLLNRASHIAQIAIERKLAEDSKRESEELFSKIFKASPIALSIAKISDGKLTEVNEVWCRLMEFSREEAIGYTLEDLNIIDSEIRAKLREEFLREGALRFVESVITTKSGNKKNILTSAELITSKGNNFAIILTLDITERMKSERLILEASNRLRFLIEGTATGLWDWDLNTNQVKYSHEWKQMLGYEDCEIVDNLDEWKRLTHTDDVDNVLKIVGKFLKKRTGTLETEFRMQHKSGEYRWILSRAAILFDEEMKSDHLVGLHIDITERKQIEEELKKSKKELEQLNKHQNEIREEERTNLSRELHDELGQNLTALKIDLKNAQNKYTGDMESFKKFGIMLSIVDETIKKVQEISSDLRPGILDDLGLVPAIEWYTDEFENRTKIKCTCTLEDNEINNPLFNTALYRIVQEALTNIIRHAKASNVNIKLLYDKDKVLLTIKDDGIGIPEEKIYQTSSLGLIGIRERIRHFNGSFSIVTRKNKGTELKVIIPLKKQLTQ